MPEVALAGFAFSGDFEAGKQRFFHSLAYEQQLKASGKPIYANMLQAIEQNPPQNFKLVRQIDELRGRDQAIAVALLISAETVSVERIAGFHKLFVLIRGQVLFFDFKLMTVVRSYPISFGNVHVLDRAPSQIEIAERVRLVYEGYEGKPGIITRFANTLTSASLPTQVSRFLQVTKVDIKPEAMKVLPQYISRDVNSAQTWAADIVSEALSTRAGVPIIPFAKGYAVGNVLPLRVSDGRVYDLQLPKPDYEITAEFSDFRKIKFSESVAGTNYIYGSYATMRIEEPLTGKVYFNSSLKNGESKSVPVTQTYVDDFPAYYDSINRLFVKLAESIDGKVHQDWLKSAAGPDIHQHITNTKELFKLCK